MDDAGFYALLGVEPTASATEIRRAYHALAKKLHPDRVGQDEQARLQMAKVGEAWAVLRNPALRLAYDEDGREGVDNLSDFEDEEEGEGAAAATDGSPRSAEPPHKTHVDSNRDGASSAAAGASKARPARDAAPGGAGDARRRVGLPSEHASRTTPKPRPRPRSKPREPAAEPAASDASSFGSFLSWVGGAATTSLQPVAGSSRTAAAPNATTREAAPRPQRSTAAAAASGANGGEQLAVLLAPDAAALVDAVAEAVRRTEERAAERYERALASLVRELMPGVGEAAAALRARQAWDSASRAS